MKILIVHNTYQQPGGEDVVFEQERQLLERMGHHVLTYRRTNWEVETYSGLGRLALARNTLWAGESRREFLALLHEQRPDVVHVHNTFMMISPAIYSACQEAGVPVAQTLHNYRFFCPAATYFREGKVCEECTEHNLWRSIRYACYRESRAQTSVVALMLAFHHLRGTWDREVDCFVALTRFARDKFVAGGLPLEKFFVKPNFVHPDPGARAGDGDYVLFVGRLAPEKQAGILLEAWKRLGDRIPLVVIGGGPEQAQLEARAAREGLSAVRFQGQTPRADTLAAINRARFLVFSSGWYENFPMTIGEAFACSTPVVCSRLGAMQEIVEDGRTGLHFTCGDADDLAAKVDWAWSHPGRLREMGGEARREFESKYTAERNYPLLMEVYERARKARAGGAPSEYAAGAAWADAIPPGRQHESGESP